MNFHLIIIPKNFPYPNKFLYHREASELHKSCQRCATRPPPTLFTALKPATRKGERTKVLEKLQNKKARDNPAA